MEANVNGFAEGIALDINGFVSEGSGVNVFVVHREKLITAPLGNSVLPGITRDSVQQIARDLGITTVEQMIPREMLYIADEAFFTGTAAEVTPIRSVDKIDVGQGGIGPITKAIQKEFYAIVRAARRATATAGSLRCRCAASSRSKEKEYPQRYEDCSLETRSFRPFRNQGISMSKNCSGYLCYLNSVCIHNMTPLYSK